jgi:ribonucleoside-triphosphate reductase
MIFTDTHGDRKVRQFSLSPAFLADYKDQQPKWGPVGYFTYKRTYALPLSDEEGAPTEEFWQTCQRVVEGVYNVQKIHCRRMGLPWDNGKAQRSAQEMFRRMWEFKFTPPGRGLAKMGTDYMFEHGGASLNNCAFVSSERIDEEFADPFVFLMDMSMLGVGVGGDTRGAGKAKLVMPKMTDEPFVVGDSREGWVAMAKTCLNAFVGKGAYPTTLDFTQVRPRGRRIMGFGGTASGPGPLAKMAKNFATVLKPHDCEVHFEECFDEETGEITYLHTYFSGQGTSRKISSGDITDIFNMVGACVVAGGVRRSAEVMFGDKDDIEFRTLKDPSDLIEWGGEVFHRQQVITAFDEGSISSGQDVLDYYTAQETDIHTPLELLDALVAKGVDVLKVEVEDFQEKIEAHPLRTHRWASNNSIFGDVGMDYGEVADSIAKNGEPGILWLKNAQDYGRMVDPPNYKDRRAQGANPCVEQTLESYELCCLVETYPAHHDSYEDFQRTLKFAYLYAKTVTLVPTHNPRTNAVMTRNRRIGCSMSGIRQCIERIGRREYLNWCDKGYNYIQELDSTYADWLGIPRSIKTTSIKPSGTVSLLCGATPGVHPAHSPYYIRNIRVSENSPLIPAVREAGYTVEKDVYADATLVVSFPVKVKNCTVGKDDVSIWEQVALASDIQRYWADNQVSCTVTFKQEEAAQIGTVLEVFEDRLKAISFLPLDGHGYAQAPYISITEAQYNEMAAKVRPLVLTGSTHEKDDLFCTTDACEIRAFRDET